MTHARHSLFHYVTAPAPRYMLRIAVLDHLFKQYINKSIDSFLEIGPGLGDVTHYLLENTNIQSGGAIDPSLEVINILQKRLSNFTNFKSYHGELNHFSLDTVNLICAFEVLEHIENDDSFLKKIQKTLTPDGLFFMSVPAYQRKWQRQDEWAGHVRRYEKDDLRQKLHLAGFRIEAIFDYGFPLMNLLTPIKEIYYKKITSESRLERTLNSGISRPLFGNKNTWLFHLIYLPFMLMQKRFYNTERGDGLIVVARKS